MAPFPSGAKKFLFAAFALAAASAAFANIGYLKETLAAPGFSVKTLDGKEFTLADHRKKVVALVFWATWCGPCRQEIPHLVELQSKYAKDLVIVGLSVDTIGPEKVTEFTKRYNVNYRVALAPQEVLRQYGGAQSIPTLFLVDRQGNLRTRIVGSHPRADLEREILALLNEKKAPAKKS
jgi:thiol-disulfide isomerase/thioredoxin